MHSSLGDRNDAFSIRLYDVRLINACLLNVRSRVILRRTRRLRGDTRGVLGSALLGRARPGGCGSHVAATCTLDQVFGSLVLEVLQNGVTRVERLQRPWHRVRRTLPGRRYSAAAAVR